VAEGGLTLSTSAGQHVRVVSALTIGKGAPVNDSTQLLLCDPAVSRRHAVIVWDGCSGWVGDLGSMTGTRLVYGATIVQIVPGTRHALTDGDVVVIGAERLTVCIDAEVGAQPGPRSQELAAR
jgi:pSer/pThr/pTyr-binding forkhead associated (FHA) protein